MANPKDGQMGSQMGSQSDMQWGQGTARDRPTQLIGSLAIPQCYQS